MKKLMIAMGAAALLGAVHAEDTGIVSSDIVGYTGQNVGANKFAMVGVQFEGVANADGEIAINDFITGDFAAVDYDEDDNFLSTAPQIQVWNGSEYATYYYLNAHDGNAKGWCDDWGDYSEDTLAPGQAAWFWAKTGASKITSAGQVSNDADATIQCPANKFTMAANYLPIALDLNSESQVVFTGLTAVDFDDNDEFLSTAPQVQVWNGSEYATYYYLNAHDGNAKGWCDDWGDIIADTIPAGRGFWIWAKTGAFSLTFKK